MFLQLSSLTEWFAALCTCVQFLPTVNEEVPFWDFQLDWTFCRNPHKCTSLSHCVSSSASSDVQIDWTFCCNLNRCLSLSHCASASASSDFQLYWTLCWNKCWNLLWNVNWSRRAEGDRRLRNMFPLLQRNQCWNMVATESEAHVRRTWGALNWALAQQWVSDPKVGQRMRLP